MGILVHVCRENNLYLRGILFRDTVRSSNCVLRVTAFLWKDQEFDCAVFFVTTLFFFHNKIPIPLFLRDPVWFIFRTHTPYFSFVYLCFQLQWNKKIKKNLECKQEHQVLFHVLCCFFLTACKKIPPSLPYQGKAIKLFLRSQWITIKHSCNILAWHELWFFCHECGSGVSRRKLLHPLLHLHQRCFRKKKHYTVKCSANIKSMERKI